MTSEWRWTLENNADNLTEMATSASPVRATGAGGA